MTPGLKFSIKTSAHRISASRGARAVLAHIHGNAPLGAIERDKEIAPVVIVPRKPAPIIASHRMFNFDDICAHVGQVLGAEGASNDSGKVKHPHATKRPFIHIWLVAHHSVSLLRRGDHTRFERQSTGRACRVVRSGATHALGHNR
jgi:hypothetical protein